MTYHYWAEQAISPEFYQRSAVDVVRLTEERVRRDIADRARRDGYGPLVDDIVAAVVVTWFARAWRPDTTDPAGERLQLGPAAWAPGEAIPPDTHALVCRIEAPLPEGPALVEYAD